MGSAWQCVREGIETERGRGDGVLCIDGRSSKRLCVCVCVNIETEREWRLK